MRSELKLALESARFMLTRRLFVLTGTMTTLRTPARPTGITVPHISRTAFLSASARGSAVFLAALGFTRATTSTIANIATSDADTDAMVLLRGESGVGKDLVARTIHAQHNSLGFRDVARGIAAGERPGDRQPIMEAPAEQIGNA